MIKGGRKGKHGRLLTPAEIRASEEYDRVLDSLPTRFNPRSYDRRSLMEAFPELKEAFERIVSLHTFYVLRGEYDYEDDDG